MQELIERQGLARLVFKRAQNTPRFVHHHFDTALQLEAVDLRTVILETDDLAQVDVVFVVVTVLVVDRHFDLQGTTDHRVHGIVIVAVQTVVDGLVLPQGDIAAVFINVQAEHDIPTGIFAHHIIALRIKLDRAAIGRAQARAGTIGEAELEAAGAGVFLIGAGIDQQFEQIIAVHLGVADHRSDDHRVDFMPDLIVRMRIAHFTLRRARRTDRLVDHHLGAVFQTEPGDLRTVILEADHLAHIDLGIVGVAILVVHRHLDLQGTFRQRLQCVVVIAIRAMVDRLVLPQSDVAIVLVDTQAEDDIVVLVLTHHIVAIVVQLDNAPISGR